MKANNGKRHLILSKQCSISLKIQNVSIENYTCEKLLRVKLYNKRKFNEHLCGLIKNKVSRTYKK